MSTKAVEGGGGEVGEKGKWFVEANPELIAGLEVRKYTYLNVCMVDTRVASIADELLD